MALTKSCCILVLGLTCLAVDTVGSPAGDDALGRCAGVHMIFAREAGSLSLDTVFAIIQDRLGESVDSLLIYRCLGAELVLSAGIDTTEEGLAHQANLRAKAMLAQQLRLAVEPNVQSELARVCCLLGHWGEAASHFRAVLNTDPRRIADRVLYARALRKLGQYNEAARQKEIAEQTFHEGRREFESRFGDAKPILDLPLENPTWDDDGGG